MAKIGIYSGSFNPIHLGHLALANWLCEYGEVDEVWFVVSPHNPFKKSDDLADEATRLEATVKAIGDYPRFRVSDIEFSMHRPSYTIDTLRRLRAEHPEHDFHLIIGSDNWDKFDLWKESDALLDEFSVIIYPRRGHKIEQVLPARVRLVDSAPLIEISSTFVRSALSEGKDIRFFLP